MPTPPLEIRLATVADAAGIAAIYEPIVRETAISFELVPPSAAAMAERIAATLTTYPWLVALHGGQLAGYAYAGQHHERAAYRWTVDVSVYIAASSRRAGVGKALYQLLFDILRRQGHAVACAGVALPNAASVGLHESLGFVPVGTYRQVGYKFGRWHDVGWWQLDLQPRVANPPEPTPLPELLARGGDLRRLLGSSP